jgi:hypothetical protein
MNSQKAALIWGLLVLFSVSSIQAGSLTQSSFSYLTSTPEIHYLVTVNRKTIVSASLQVVDVGDVAPAGHEVANAELIAQKNIPSSFSFSKPDAGWPVGRYQIVIKDNEQVIDTVVFNVIAHSDAAIVSDQPSRDQSKHSHTLAQGTGGVLTSDAADAYVDALEFIHDQMGQPRQFRGADRQAVMDNLAASFNGYPQETQRDLSNARALLKEYQASWNYLGADEQKAFAYSVLAIAYGEESASQALGYQNNTNSGGGSSYYSDGASFVSDGNCSYFSSEYGSVSTCD